MGKTAYTTLSRAVGIEEAPEVGVDAAVADLVVLQELDDEGQGGAAAATDAGGAAPLRGTLPYTKVAYTANDGAAAGAHCKALLIMKQLIHFECLLRCSEVTMTTLQAAIQFGHSRKASGRSF